MFNQTNLKWVIVGGAFVLVFAIILFLRRPGPETSSVDEGPRPRQEVLDWIEKHYGQDHKKKVALTRLAEVDQYILVYRNKALEVAELESLAMECYGDAFPSNEKIDNLPPYEAIDVEYFNTYARARKRIAYHGKLNGHVFQEPVISSWEKQCEAPFSL